MIYILSIYMTNPCRKPLSRKIICNRQNEFIGFIVSQMCPLGLATCVFMKYFATMKTSTARSLESLFYISYDCLDKLESFIGNYYKAINNSISCDAFISINMECRCHKKP